MDGLTHLAAIIGAIEVTSIWSEHRAFIIASAMCIIVIAIGHSAFTRWANEDSEGEDQ